jgi:Uma2 family endonuclease
LKVVAPAGQVRYPDVSVVAGGAVGTADHIAPFAVFEVLSASTRLVDLQVKPAEYATVPSILLYVILATDNPEVAILRRRNGWAPDPVVVTLDLAEIGVTLDLADLYAAP